MEIHVFHGNTRYTVPGSVAIPLTLPGKLSLAVNAGPAIVRPDESWVRLRECGMDFRLRLPNWLNIPESTHSRSRESHAKYLAVGNLPFQGGNLGVLLQGLRAGRETSCHSHPPIDTHPGTDELFLPITNKGGATPLLYTPDYPQGRPIPPEGCLVKAGTPHQLQAPPGVPTVTLLFMWPIPYATWMGGHVPHDPPFIPYTPKDRPLWLPPDIPIAGVGLIATFKTGTAEEKVLMLTELGEKPELHKRAGMESFPMETRLSNDEPLEMTMERLLGQELPGLENDLVIEDEPFGMYQIGQNTWLLVWHAHSRTEALPSDNHDQDVTDHRWVPLVDAVNSQRLRGGAYEALRDYRSGRCGVVCERCQKLPM